MRLALSGGQLFAAPYVLAHEAPAVVGPGELAAAWGGDLLLLSGVVLSGAIYGHGVSVLWRRAGFGAGIGVWRASSFYLGLFTVLVAVASPLDALAHTLFSAHMVQHMLLVLLAAPLLAFGTPILPLLWALPAERRRRVTRWWKSARGSRRLWRFMTQPLIAWCLFALVLWAWHLPVLYQLAVARPAVHALEHFTLVAASYLFWWLVIQPVGRRTLHHGAAILFVFTTSVQVTVLGALITLAPEPLYPIYGSGSRAWALEPITDQRLAALFMRTPMALVFLFAVAALFLRWLAVMERRR